MAPTTACASSGDSEASGQALAHAVVVKARDYFGSVGVVGESTMTVRLATTDNATLLSGLASLSFETQAPAVLRWKPSETYTSLLLRPNAVAKLEATGQGGTGSRRRRGYDVDGLGSAFVGPR